VNNWKQLTMYRTLQM